MLPTYQKQLWRTAVLVTSYLYGESNMPRKLTTEEFIEKAKAIHGDKYDYSLSNYINAKEKIVIVCKIHGKFYQNPNGHLTGNGCYYCGIDTVKNSRLLTTEIFIKKAKEIHGDIFDYSLVEYISSHRKVKIICNTHGIFEQTPNSHLNGCGCFSCSIKKSNVTTDQFIKKAKEIHGDTFDYSLVEYKNTYSKIKIICKIHGIFEQIAGSHLKGRGCNKCRYLKNTLTTDQFIKKSTEIHGDRYDYSNTIYIKTRNKLEINCKLHGIFKITPNAHLRGVGCPKCKSSKGEMKIETYLKNRNINFINQKKFDNCKNKYCLSFDFYLPDYNMCIEYDGQQHFIPMRRSKSQINMIQKLKYTQNNDQLKNEYCKNNNISILRIPYWEFKNIESILDDYLLRLIS